ncbi:tRNA methyltransferase 10 homolog A-like isoform X2 [Watersipora subatra]|uniref:tRNA methyltransferase 10 homolog A-like isoform X2 n=1 Tax=Watersipora subatra TaxID=2589382 RepID=UPI00355AEFA5
MFAHRTVPLLCRNVLCQSGPSPWSVQKRLLVSHKKVHHENLDLASGEEENRIQLRDDAKDFYEDLKAFYPYQTCWRMKDQHIDMFNNSSMPSRLDYMRKLSLEENQTMKLLSKKFDEKAEREALSNAAEDSETKSLCSLLWTRSTTINRWQSHKLCHAHMYGKDIVIDCGFEKALLSNKRHLREYFLSLCKIFQANKRFPYPANIVLSRDPAFQPSNSHFLSMHTESYLDLYPRSQLVYLTSDSPYVMNEYDKHTTYIVGGLADTGGTFQRASIAKARQDGVKSQRLPIRSSRSFAKNLVIPFHRMIPLLNIAHSTNIETAIQEIIPQKDRRMLLQAKSISVQVEIEKARRLAALARKDVG